MPFLRPKCIGPEGESGLQRSRLSDGLVEVGISHFQLASCVTGAAPSHRGTWLSTRKGRPNLGPFLRRGVVTINSQTKEITRSGQYWAFVTLIPAVVKWGARRFDSQSTAIDLHHVAVENPDGQHVLVVSNAGAARRFNCNLKYGG